MMNFKNLGEYMSAQPFRPFRINMVSGQSSEIRHPEMMMVGINSVRIYNSHKEGAEMMPFWHDVSMFLIESLEPLPQQQSTIGQN